MPQLCGKGVPQLTKGVTCGGFAPEDWPLTCQDRIINEILYKGEMRPTPRSGNQLSTPPPAWRFTFLVRVLWAVVVLQDGLTCKLPPEFNGKVDREVMKKAACRLPMSWSFAESLVKADSHMHAIAASRGLCGCAGYLPGLRCE